MKKPEKKKPLGHWDISDKSITIRKTYNQCYDEFMEWLPGEEEINKMLEPHFTYEQYNYNPSDVRKRLARKLNKRIRGGGGMRSELYGEAKHTFRDITDEERLEILADYCVHCGIYDGDEPRGCQCWNDE